jgi:hypothetical protein
MWKKMGKTDENQVDVIGVREIVTSLWTGIRLTLDCLLTNGES